ncbi:MAG: four helix bundle protein [Victivallales bacterium]
MRNEKNTVLVKAKTFAIRIVKLFAFLRKEKKDFILSKQILRSGTSIGANLAEAEFAVSEKDFLSKNYIALKECAETIYWLELMYQTDTLTKEQFDSIHQDCLELLRLLSATTKTMKRKLQQKEVGSIES